MLPTPSVLFSLSNELVSAPPIAISAFRTRAPILLPGFVNLLDGLRDSLDGRRVKHPFLIDDVILIVEPHVDLVMNLYVASPNAPAVHRRLHASLSVFREQPGTRLPQSAGPRSPIG